MPSNSLTAQTSGSRIGDDRALSPAPARNVNQTTGTGRSACNRLTIVSYRTRDRGAGIGGPRPPGPMCASAGNVVHRHHGEAVRITAIRHRSAPPCQDVHIVCRSAPMCADPRHRVPIRVDSCRSASPFAGPGTVSSPHPRPVPVWAPRSPVSKRDRPRRRSRASVRTAATNAAVLLTPVTGRRA